MDFKGTYKGLNEQELIIRIKENSDYLGVVYKNCKNNAVRFMQRFSNGSLKEYELEDVFHDAVIVLYEKITENDFVLTCTVQTYLNSVCKNQLGNKLKKDSKITEFEDQKDDDVEEENSMSFKSSINDALEEIEDEKEAQFQAIERALNAIRLSGGHCYELLTLFWYHKKSMVELTEILGYNNPDTTKQQKARCQKRLEKIAFNELNQ
ncbi:RNA polymerase sigma factor [Aquirufa sp. OSTEICH-129A]